MQGVKSYPSVHDIPETELAIMRSLLQWPISVLFPALDLAKNALFFANGERVFDAFDWSAFLGAIRCVSEGSFIVEWVKRPYSC